MTALFSAVPFANSLARLLWPSPVSGSEPEDRRLNEAPHIGTVHFAPCHASCGSQPLLVECCQRGSVRQMRRHGSSDYLPGPAVSGQVWAGSPEAGRRQGWQPRVHYLPGPQHRSRYSARLSHHPASPAGTPVVTTSYCCCTDMLSGAMVKQSLPAHAHLLDFTPIALQGLTLRRGIHSQGIECVFRVKANSAPERSVCKAGSGRQPRRAPPGHGQLPSNCGLSWILHGQHTVYTICHHVWHCFCKCHPTWASATPKRWVTGSTSSTRYASWLCRKGSAAAGSNWHSRRT